MKKVSPPRTEPAKEAASASAPDAASGPAPTLGSLASFQAPLRALIFGASGGLGAALTEHLRAQPEVGEVFGAARSAEEPWRFTLEDEASIAKVVANASANGPLDLVIVATGLLHAAPLRPEKTWRQLSGEALMTLFQVNAVGPALIAKHCLPQLRRDAKAVFAAISARVGSIEDNRLGGWHSYRASKAALNMLLRNFAIELKLSHPQALCVGLHPGTVDTALSAPFQSALPPGQLQTPQASAAALIEVLDRLSVEDSGRLWAYDGQPIPS
ncbi:MAG: SDR family NAD(P)-dependent oxidoreductase [Steroidobacteraceae bacterium]|jgi:NAD(P)-dependent dehydrogenase (short-subunit alcohol dehydrogenase family)